MTEIQKKLFQMALQAQKNSHSPYSKAQIGASHVMSDGSYWSGCNIENASYGGTVCAERVSIWKSISENAKGPITEILVVSSATEAWPPCGLCRQVMAEFASEGTLVHVANQKGDVKTYRFDELLPAAFTPAYLGSK